ncbi:MAG TPA: FYVE zinc finger domain-containing protein [Bryobacteraceae bacterium]|jgi:hypothetical protein
MPAVPPKTVRAITRAPVQLHTPASVNLACWNWALHASQDPAPPIGAIYDYVNGNGPAPTVLTHPAITPALLNDLLGVRNTYLPYRGVAYDAAKRTVLTDCSKRMLPILCGIYGLQVSAAPTDVEVGLKFEAQLVPRPVTVWVPDPNPLARVGRLVPGGHRDETDLEIAERHSNLQVGYEHMWIRFRKKITVETWVDLGSLYLHDSEQAPAHKIVHRVYVSTLLQEHLNKLRTLLRVRKNAPMYAHPAARQPWIADLGVNNCTWCQAAFSFNNRRHHCRACGRIFCSDCAFRTEMVALPSNPAFAANPGAVSRVCDTCYTGAL